MADVSRTWSTIVYQESCKETWLDDLEQLKIPCYVSPLHDSDQNEDGSLKKPHWHVMLMFQGQKNRKNIQELVKAFGGVGAEKVEHKDAYAKYLCHLCSPGKHVYDINDVICLNGAPDYAEFCITNLQDKYELLNQMLDWCNRYNIYYFCELVDYARLHRKDWFRLLADRNSHLLWEYIKSKTWKDGHS